MAGEDDLEDFPELKHQEFMNWFLKQPAVIAYFAPRPDDPTFEELFTLHSPEYILSCLEELDSPEANEMGNSAPPLDSLPPSNERTGE